MTVTGQFAAIATDPGLTWDVSSLYATGQVVLTHAQGAVSADFNEDGAVDSDDLGAWQAGFGTNASASHGDGDTDGDEDVDGGDFLVWQQEFGTATVSLENAAVPEPASCMLLLAFAVFALTSSRMMSE